MGKTVNIGTLVDLVVARAKVDKTSPGSSNLRVGWRTDQLLTGDVDVLVCYGHKDPAVYAEIGRQVLTQVKDLPEMAALANLAIFRGERLLPPSDERKQNLLQMVDDLEKTISALPEGSRKWRCSSLFRYHTGVFYDAYGCFDQAAAAQLQAAKEAEKFGDLPGAAISSFIGTVYQLKSVLCCKSTDEAEATFYVLEERYAQLVEAVRSTAFEVSWGQRNAPIHMIEACVWLGRDHPDWDKWVATAIAAAEGLGQAFKPGVEFVRAFDLGRRGDAGAEEALLAVAMSNIVNEQKATAMLLLARHAQKAGDVDKAKELVAQMPETGAQHVRSVAEHLLTK